MAVRQGNSYMRRALKGLMNRHMPGGIASLEHPYNSYVCTGLTALVTQT